MRGLPAWAAFVHRAAFVLDPAGRGGQAMRQVFPQFSPYALPNLVSIEAVDRLAAKLDLIFCALPHATPQKVVKQILATAPAVKIVDISADFRLSDPAAYARWY